MLLSRIVVYPIKSLDGIAVEEARITSGGILENDRVYSLLDESGAYVNGKRSARVQQIRAEFNQDFEEVLLWQSGESAKSQFVLREPALLNEWMSAFLGFTVRLTREPVSGFPDDRVGYGPTVVSEASLKEVSSWFPGIAIDNIRRRFRTNLELADVPSFWEDRLYREPGKPKTFWIGSVLFFGHNPCQRCVVPTRDPDSAEQYAGFQKTFMELRKQHLQYWAEPKQFNHFYRFATNTSIPFSEKGKVLRSGDSVSLSSSKQRNSDVVCQGQRRA